MDIFSESPKSFKIDRKSPLASTLKSSISNKLVRFLGNYTDDVLAEYIIVLVCNGKHQIQARNDLEAFLGERSGEFVSWLWDHLSKYGYQINSTIGLLDPNAITVTNPNSSAADRDLRRSRSKDVQNHDSGKSDSSLTKNEKCCHPYGSSTVILNDMELHGGNQCCEGPVAPMNEVNTNKVHAKKQRNAIPTEVGATENCRDGSMTHKPSRIECSSLIPSGKEQRSEYTRRPNEIVNPKGSELPSQLLDFSTREMTSRNLQPYNIEPHTREIYAGDVTARSSPRAVQELPCGTKKSRGSVWDRLGKPCEETGFRDDRRTVDAHDVDIVETEQEVHDTKTLLVPVPNKDLGGSMKNGGQELDKSCRKLELGASMTGKHHPANNICQKRHFGDSSSGPSSCSVSLLGRTHTNHRYNRSAQDFKRLKSTSEAATPALVSQVQDVKQRLQQMEIEMSKLRTKQLEIKKGGQPHMLSNSGVIKHSVEDTESRTVIVTNVHFAATKEDLSLHFSKCGMVLNVVILTDVMNAQPKGSAYITFANTESVDKAVALCGTSFFSRTLKVLRKADEATVDATPPQRAGKPSQAQSSQLNKKTVSGRPFYPSSHLQWRREPLPAPSEPSASITREGGVSSVAYRQQLSVGSLASMGTTKTAASTETPTAA